MRDGSQLGEGGRPQEIDVCIQSPPARSSPGEGIDLLIIRPPDTGSPSNRASDGNAWVSDPVFARAGWYRDESVEMSQNNATRTAVNLRDATSVRPGACGMGQVRRGLVRRMDLLVIFIAVAIGATIGVQPVINARLGNFAGDAAVAALLSTATSTTCMLIYVLIMRPELPSMAVMRSGPWWIWTGGLIGAVYVAVSLNIAQRLGATTLVAVIVVGQMTAALIVDHFGLMGLVEHPISPLRILGVLFLIAGVALIRMF